MKHSSSRPLTLALLGLFLVATPLFADLPVYDASAANPDPTTQGWTAGSDVAVGSDSTPPYGLIYNTANANVGPVSASPETGTSWQLRDQQSNSAFDLPFYNQTFTTTFPIVCPV